MRSATCVIGVALLVLAARPGRATADDDGPVRYFSVVDRVDVEPAAIGGVRLRIALSALALQGQLIDLSDPKAVQLMIGNSKLDAPHSVGLYSATSSETAVVIVVQANLAYADTLPAIVQQLDDVVLSTLGDRTQLAFLPYGESTSTGKLGSLKAMRGKFTGVTQDGTAGEPALLDSLDRAVTLLKKAKPQTEGRPLRKLIIAIGDGRDRSGDRDRVTALGVRADREGVRIHSFGYAPSNVRRPLLTLGELSKRSLGTFRWVRAGGADSWQGAFQQLRDEINKQYVLTYFLPSADDVSGKKLRVDLVGRIEAKSNEVKIPEPGCGREACAGYCVDGACYSERQNTRRGFFGWVLLIVGIAVGAAVVLGVVGFVMQRRNQPLPGTPGQPPVPGQPAAGAPPGLLPIPGVKPPKAKKSKTKDQPPVAAPPPATGPALLVLTGPRTGQRIPLQHGFTIGKAPTSHLVLDDGYTSSQHAQVGVDQTGRCHLYDRNSTNGTFVNGVRVTEVVLDHGMSVRIGSTEMRFLAQ